LTTDNKMRVAALERALFGDAPVSLSDEDHAAQEEFAYRLAPLADRLDGVRPGDDLFARITGEIEAKLPLAGIYARNGADGEWQPLCDGIDIKTLWHSTQSRRHVFLVRIKPGAILPEHRHSGDEECMVLEGDMVVNGVTFGPGDFQVAFANTVHPVITSVGGCTCMISVGLLAA